MAKRKTIKEKNKELKPLGRQLVHYGIVLHIKPNDEQIYLINKTFGCSRFVYNQYLSEKQLFYQKTGSTLSLSHFKANVLNPSKKTDEYEFLKEVDKFALETACENVDDAYDRFFKGQNKYPKFKTKRKSKKAYTTKFTNNNISIDGNFIKLPKVGKVKFIAPKTQSNQDKFKKLVSNELKILNATISFKGGKYFVSVCCEEEIDLIEKLDLSKIDITKIVGIDLGLKDFATISNGVTTQKIENPKYFAISEKKLAKLQKKLSKKKLDSKNYAKARKKLAKLHKKIADQRTDFAHKLSRKLVDENQVIVVENLNIKGMVKNKNLSKAIQDAGWSKVLTFLKYKSELAGKHYIEIDRWFASSKTCSVCGEKKIMLTLSEREWTCGSCGTIHDRDENAALNIRKEGVKILGAA